MKLRTLVIGSLLLAACGGDSTPALDASMPRTDSGVAVDAGSIVRADGGPETDGGPIARDDGGPVPPGLLFFDDFEYAVGRDGDTNAVETFQAHGWEGAKTQQDTDRSPNGYVYTVDSIPGYTGAFPGRSSSRVVALEALPASSGGQTDFYLQYGSESGPIGQIPANHWFQFWLYSPATDPQRSVYTQGKFIYPTRTYYPASTTNEGYVYIAYLNKGSGQTLLQDCSPGLRSTPCDHAFFATTWDGTDGLTNNFPDGSETFDQNLSPEAPIVPAQWTLVKMHIDISGTDPRAVAGQAVYEQWIRRVGDATWTKTTEWLGGVTENLGAPVNMTPTFTDGFRTFRMPTTTGATTSAPGDWYDYWLYLDDFALAGAEADLPVYP